MKIFIYKTLIVITSIYFLFQFTVGQKIRNYEAQIESLLNDKQNREKIVSKIEKIKILGGDLRLELEGKYSISDLNTWFSNYNNIAAQVISKIHNMLPKNKNDKTDIFLTPFIAEEIYKDAKAYCLNLEYIVDTLQVVDYWSPDKKR